MMAGYEPLKIFERLWTSLMVEGPLAAWRHYKMHVASGAFAQKLDYPNTQRGAGSAADANDDPAFH
jgi:hypothetical protein